MSSHRSSGRVSTRKVSLKNGVSNGKVALKNGVPLSLPPNPTVNLQWDEVKPLSGKPYEHHLLSSSNLHPRYHLMLAINLRSELPSIAVPTILTYKGKDWTMIYSGQSKQQILSNSGWKKFAVDNCLRVGDACIFELMECKDNKVIFEVQILRGDIPFSSELLENDLGLSPHNPIVLN
ncbi:hypothetical protein VNO78_11982 [Psophocarpus tetragonolobus]|uniref:TF-B3 domain-containing protein n=1 Tax=Psophocarpus tetragonolobus TaxID=3891 RepID=A0AAN9SM98_PSOTE